MKIFKIIRISRKLSKFYNLRENRNIVSISSSSFWEIKHYLSKYCIKITKFKIYKYKTAMTKYLLIFFSIFIYFVSIYVRFWSIDIYNILQYTVYKHLNIILSYLNNYIYIQNNYIFFFCCFIMIFA